MPQGTLIPPVEDGPWAKGVDSYLEPTQVQKGFYRWGVNVTNRGGTVRTRPGLSVIPVTWDGIPGVPRIGRPRGITVFTDRKNITNLVICIGQLIFFLPYPFEGDWTWIPQLKFEGTGPVCFVRCITSVTEDAEGNITDIDPFPTLIIQDGMSRCGYWDGVTARHLNPAKKVPFGGPSETPIGLWSAWSGNRLWVSNGSRIRASNLMNPIKFTEENLLAEGGYLQFSDTITGVSNTWDFTALIVFTPMTTSTLMSSLMDRKQWASTPGFQKVVFSGIGCVGGNAMATQWGLLWWYSHDGLIGYDEGLRVYQTSKVSYKDREMAWSKSNIAQLLQQNIAMGSFENLLFVSAPSGDLYNAHTWVMDEAPLDVLTYWGYFGLPSWSSVWEGVRPVAWITAPVKGNPRTFCLSQDYNGQNNVWEAVTETRIDNTVDSNLARIQRAIGCSLETRLIGYDGNYKYFRFAEIYIDNLEGEVNVTVSYAPRRGGYKQVLQKHIVSSDFIIQNPLTQIPVDTFIFDPLRPQSRVIRTVSEAKTYGTPGNPYTPNTGDDAYQGVLTSANVPFPRQKDYAFSLLIEWTGRMSISTVRFYFDAEEQEIEGIAETNEDTDRTVDMAGINTKRTTLTPYVIDPEAMDFQSDVITTTAPVWADPIYQST